MSFRIHFVKFSHNANRYTAIKRSHVPNVDAIDAIPEILEISVAARRNRYSWFSIQKAHLYVHLHRKVSDLYRCAEFSVRALSKSHQSVRPNSAAIRKYCDLYYLYTRFTLFIGTEIPLIFSFFVICPFRFHFFIFYFILSLENYGKLSLFYWNERQWLVSTVMCRVIYIIASVALFSYPIVASLEFRTGRSRSRQISENV